MSNKSSKASHIPQRMCVICREKRAKNELYRFVILANSIIFDMQMKLQKRGYYCCNDNVCLIKLDKWKAKRNKK